MGSSSRYTRREELTFLQYLRYRPQERIDRIPPGVPSTRITGLCKSLGVSRRMLLAFLGIPCAGMNGRVQTHLSLSDDECARVQGIEGLIGQVQAMVEDSSVPAEAAGFDAARWLGHWLRNPLPALGGRLPASYLHTLEGQKLVRKMLAMITSGSYA